MVYRTLGRQEFKLSMRDLFFDPPYWFLGCCVLAGACLLKAGNSRQNRKLLSGGIAALAAAAALYLLGWIIDTPREKAIQGTRQLVAAFEKRDAARIDALLHPMATLLWMNRQDILTKSRTAFDDYHIKSVSITSTEALEQADTVTVTFSTMAQLDSPQYAGNAPSRWQIVWVQTPQGLLARDFSVVQLPGISVNDLLDKYRK